MGRPRSSRVPQSRTVARDDNYRLRATERRAPALQKPPKQGTKPSSRKQRGRGEPGGWAWPSPCYTEVDCPACDQPVFLVTRGGRRLFLERQRRLVVFAGPYETLRVEVEETGEETVALLPVEPLTLWEEYTDRLVMGRAATEEERRKYSAAVKAGGQGLNGVAPWTIGHESHLLHCPLQEHWASGVAELRLESLDSDRYGPVFYGLSLAQAQARLGER